MNRFILVSALIGTLSCPLFAQIGTPTPKPSHPVRRPSPKVVVVHERKETRQSTPQAAPTFDVKDMKQQPAGEPVNVIWYPPMALPPGR